MKMLSIDKGFWKVWFGFSVFTLPLLVVFPYLEVELKTFLFSNKISNLSKICQSYSNSELKYTKVLDYNQSLKRSKIHCIFKDTKENLSLNMIYEDGWKVVYTKKINSERNFYWPVYM